MPLPANDAFSLGLAHDQPRRSKTPSSPKILFSPSPARAMPKKHHKRKQPSTDQHATQEPASSVSQKRKSKHSRTHSTPNGPSSPNDVDKLQPTTTGWEIPRKALHSSIGFLTVYLYTSNGDPQHVIIALSSALAVLIPIDILRLHYPDLERVFEKCVGMFMRDSEKKSSNGVIWYLLGANIVLATLPLDIAVVSILILSWADTAASTFGKLYGSLTPRLPKRLFGVLPFAPRKSLAGFIAASVTGAAITIGFWTFIAPLRPNGLTWTWQEGISQSFTGGVDDISGFSYTFSGWAGLITIGIIAGLVTGVAEALDLGGIDDNLTLPVIAGGCLWGLFKSLGWLGRVLA